MGVSKQSAGNSHTSSTQSPLSKPDISSKHIPPPKQYIGRFAPSPTGSLHFGSLIAATASYLCARQNEKGKWLLRIEDIDTQRSHQEHSNSIIKTLEIFGFKWDEEITYQSKRNEIYQHALDTLQLQSHTYPCSCTRKKLSKLSLPGEYGYIYPGICRNGPDDTTSTNFSIRLKTNSDPVCFQDQYLDQFCQNIEHDIGDFTLKRADGIFAYQLAVVVDDHEQGITHVVRGADLFDNTPRQIYLQHLLSYNTPEYLHFPVATTADGKKLSKQNFSQAVSMNNKRSQLIQILAFLGQKTPNNDDFESLDDFWNWAVQNWDSSLIPRKMKKQYE